MLAKPCIVGIQLLASVVVGVSGMFRRYFEVVSHFFRISELFRFSFLSFLFSLLLPFFYERKTAGKYEGVVCIRVPCVIVIVVHVNRGVSVG